jgi:hypothetical protein
MTSPKFHKWIKANDIHSPHYPQEYLSCLLRSEGGSIAMGFWVRQSNNGNPVDAWFTVAPGQPPVPCKITVAYVAAFKDYGDATDK